MKVSGKYLQCSYLLCNVSKRRLMNLAPSPPSHIAEVSVLEHELERFASILSHSQRPLFLSGAGLSTESGIPDYRSPARINTYNPIKYQEFIKSIYHRRRYWARSTIGYENQMKLAQPNTAHHIITKWKLNQFKDEQCRVITQNVDSLHLKAGFPYYDFLEIHGSLRNVSCLECNGHLTRDEFQTLLKSHNTDFFEQNVLLKPGEQGSSKYMLRPDGDIQLNDTSYDYNEFVVPHCKYCHASDAMRPSVVFFGENLDKDTAATSIHWAKQADCIIVCGSSLQTQSSHRLLRYARENAPEVPIVIVNIGETRGDDMCDVKIEYYVSTVLEYVDDLISS